MKKPVLQKENIEVCFHNKYLKVYSIPYDTNPHYYNASRREVEEMVAMKSEEEFKKMVADAVTCCVIVGKEEPKMVLTHEFRYPCGQFLLSVPAGLIDPADKAEENPIFHAAIREVYEETGLVFKDGDKIEMVSPLLFSSPGMTDESNAIVLVHIADGELTSGHAEETECFDGFTLVNKEEATRILKQGKDDQGIFYSVYTWICLMAFVSGIY